MKRIIILGSLIFSKIIAVNELDYSTQGSYSFIIKGSPSKLFTMRQFNENYLSSYRLFSRSLNNVLKKKYLSDMIQLWMHSFFFMPLTHEEGHRSILTVNHIGSISQPFFNKHGAAYVNGVTDEVLKALRDNDLPNYIRLHNGGLESDYMLTNRVESIGILELDEFDNYKWEYWVRKSQIVQYLMLGLFKADVDIKEEKNELERDIVGLDTYGSARHLFRPDMEFYRYTKYQDLTSEEKDYVDRMGYRSLLNFVNPLLIGKKNYKINKSLVINAGLGYMLSPFGDFIDENIWIKTSKLNLMLTFRQFQNKKNWFHGLGINLIDYRITKNLVINLEGNYWEQPINFEFETSESFTGGALDAKLEYSIYSFGDSLSKAFTIDLGIIYKTKGFLPEEVYLDEHFGFRLGTTLRLNY